MKKLLIGLITIALVILCCCASAEEPNFFLVNYDGNGITLSTTFSPQSKIPGEPLELTGWLPTRNFYTFGGWAEYPTATEPDYLPGATFSEDRDVTLYAVWLEPTSLGAISGPCTLSASPYPCEYADAYRTFTVTESGFYRFASTGGCSSVVTPSIIVKSATGYKDWIASGDSNQHPDWSYDFVITAELQAGTTYYLYYDETTRPLTIEVSHKTYNVNFDGNGVTLSTTFSPQSKIPGEPLELMGWRPTRNFYTFGGWAESPTATEPDYLPGDTFSEDRDVTLYAVWLEPTSLGAISGPCTLSASPYPCEYADAYRTFTVTESGFYRFASTGGCSSVVTPSIIVKSATGYKDWIASGDSIQHPDWSYDFVITAELQAGTAYYLYYDETTRPLTIEVSQDFHIVSYDGNGVKLSTTFSPQSKIPGEPLELLGWLPTRDFYTFGGWAESPNATEPDYLPGDTFSEDRDVTLYAVWLEPTSLGAISGPCTLSASPYPCEYADAYRTFTVTESGFYRFASTGGCSSVVTPSIIVKSATGYKDWIASGEAISNPDWTYDFVITAELQAGTTYYLYYKETTRPLTIEVLPQYSDPNPYTATSVVPRSVTIIADSAFEGCSFDSFEVAAGTTMIGARAFANCTSLRKIVIHAKNVTIADDAFAGCTDLLIVAHKGSTAHQFAKEHGLEFRALPQQ